jgi:predicted amidohydrolase YtcJ
MRVFQEMYADLVIKNGKIVTVDGDESISEAVAVRYGIITAVGSNAEVEQLIGENTEVIDLAGRTMIPGLIDSHCHMASTGAMKLLSVDLSEEAGVKSIKDIQERLGKKAESTPEGEWVIGLGEDDSKLEEKRHPTRWELDKATTSHPVFVATVGGHFYMVNSKALEMAGVTKDTPDPVGGKFDRYPETGEVTGGLHEKALDVVMPEQNWGADPSREQASEGARLILNECASTGLTMVYDMVDQSQMRALIDLKNSGELPIRVRMDFRIEKYHELNEVGVYRGLGDDWLRLSGLKFFFDGAVSARTAAVTEPYLNQPDFYGVMATTREIAEKTIFEAYESGYRISSHANGDRAIELYLDIMEEAQRRFSREDPRNRDIHCSVVNPELVQRIKKLDILPTIFGPYAYYHGDKLLPAFGENRLEWMFAARSFLDAGVMVSAHSDHNAGPMPPLMGIHALVNRVTRAGKEIGQSQRISVMEALKLYTINAAYHSYDEECLGSIEVGKLADFVVLGRDILSIPTEEIIDIPVDMTLVGGKIVYKRT